MRGYTRARLAFRQIFVDPLYSLLLRYVSLARQRSLRCCGWLLHAFSDAAFFFFVTGHVTEPKSRDTRFESSKYAKNTLQLSVMLL